MFAELGHPADALLAVGHRIVHGGDRFTSPALVDDAVLAELEALTPLAPLHNPAGTRGIEVAREHYPAVPQVAVFDTAFHHTMPARAHLYALPRDLADRYRIRRYGFHGISHGYVARRAAEHLGRQALELNLVTLHLGNGASAAAIAGGRSIDTSMGLTPLSGLVMGTRGGDVDPGVVFHLHREAGMPVAEIGGGPRCGTTARDELRPGEQVVAPDAGQHQVVDRPRHAHQRQHPPQAAGVVLGGDHPVPVVEAPVDAVLVVGEPQLRDEAREADEQRCVEQAFPSEERVAAAVHGAQAERHDQRAGLGRGRTVEDGLPVHPRARAAGEPHLRATPARRQVDAPTCEEARGDQDASGERAQGLAGPGVLRGARHGSHAPTIRDQPLAARRTEVPVHESR